MRNILKLVCVFVTIALIFSCEPKVCRVDFGLSHTKLEVEQDGGLYVVTSVLEDFDLDAISIMNNDGEWKIADYRYIFDGENLHPSGMEYDWIRVDKAKNPITGLCDLKILVAKNESEGERKCTIELGAGDSVAGVLIVQK